MPLRRRCRAICREPVAETYLTFNILDRVKRIIVGAVSATTFTIEVDSRQYLITAKHVVATLKDEDEVSI